VFSTLAVVSGPDSKRDELLQISAETLKQYISCLDLVAGNHRVANIQASELMQLLSGKDEGMLLDAIVIARRRIVLVTAYDGVASR